MPASIRVTTIGLLLEYHAIRSSIPAEHVRPLKDPDALSTDKYRRLMKTHVNPKAYRHGVESVPPLRGETHWSRCRDTSWKF